MLAGAMNVVEILRKRIRPANEVALPGTSREAVGVVVALAGPAFGEIAFASAVIETKSGWVIKIILTRLA
jgi:hypothetical protein